MRVETVQMVIPQCSQLCVHVHVPGARMDIYLLCTALLPTGGRAAARVTFAIKLVRNYYSCTYVLIVCGIPRIPVL
eukprot:COSAG02_NODE_592_length_19856_cov_19.262793_7_plen_76_part_00